MNRSELIQSVFMRRTVFIALVVASLLRGDLVHAEQTSVVAVLPLRASDKSMKIYSKPVADAIAKRLKRKLGVSVESLPTSGAVPARVGLVVDGRIVPASNRRVVLEARVRDPAVGRAGTVVVSNAGVLSNIDELASQLAAKLAPLVRRALAAQKQRRLAKAKLRAMQPRTRPTHTAAGTKGTPVRNKRPSRGLDTRPSMVVFVPTGRAADVPIAATMIRAARKLAAASGHRIVRSPLTGVQPGQPAVKEIRRSGASYALMIHIVHVGFDWHGSILSARGRVRIVVADPKGRRVYDRTARTGTLVGSRGDRHVALLHLLSEQTVDIAAPQLKRALAR